jgi:hypothetical protein
MADPANRLTNVAGGKYYQHPVTDEKFDSVTTILDLMDKAALKQWASNLAADFVIEHLPQFTTAVIYPECGNTNNRCHLKHGRENRCERCPCGQCLPCWRRRAAYRHSYESSRRAEEGTEVHQAIHLWITTGGQVMSMTQPAKPYFESFLTWVQEYDLHPNGQPGQGDWEQLEITLLNRDHMYAGTSDGAVWIRRGRTEAADTIVDRIGGPNAEKVLVRVDYKTREKPDERLYNDMPMQGVAYERCTRAMLADGREFDPPTTHARAVLQLRPGAYSFKPMLTDDSTFEAFLGVLRAYRWINGPGKSAFDMSVWASIPPGVLGTPGLPDPWDDINYEMAPTCSRCDHAPHGGHACDPGCSCPPEPPSDPPMALDNTIVARPYVAASSPRVTGAEVVPLPPDPFTAHNNDKQVKADGRKATRTRKTPAVTTNATVQSIKDFQVGNADQTALDEPIPF